jgi:two-component system cell cycle sensor histidine kinase/response regulator CckA
MLGMTKEEVRAAGHGGIIRRDLEAEERFEQRHSAGRTTDQITFVRKDGTTFPAESMSVAYCDALGSPRAFVVFRDISERMEAQRVLRESEARLLQAQAVAQVGNWEVDYEARSVWLSPEALRIHGVPQTTSYFALEAGDLARLAEDPATVNTALDKVMHEGGPYDLEYHIRRLDDGATRMVHVKGEAVCGEAGNPVKLIGVVQDITELRQVEDALRLTQYSVDHAGDQIFWIGPDGRFIFVSDSTCEQLGYTREELLGMTVFDVDPTLTADDNAAVWEEVKRRGTLSHESVHRTKDGRDVPVEICDNYIQHNGQEYNFVFARDIAKRKEMEESLRSVQFPACSAGDQVFWINPEGRFVFVSDSACRQLGYTRNELLSMTVFDIDPTLSKDWRASWEKVKQRGSFAHEAVHRTKDGKDVPVEVSANYIQHGGQEYSLAFARDISDRKRAQAATTGSEEGLRQSHTMEAIGQLAGGIAHDFNNLLTAIMGYGNLILADEGVQGLTVQRDAEEIRSAAERASALTQKILAFSRRQTLQPRVVSPNRLLSEMGLRLEEVLGKDIEVVSVQQPDLGYVEVDPQQFEQVVVNLVANARDAMPEGGRLILETRNVDLSDDYCDLYQDLQPGSYVLLSVSDTGAGMSPEVMGHIFEPFFTTREHKLGAGLGLPVVYGVVRQSGGFVSAYSEVGRGSTFKVYLPRVPGPIGPMAERAAVAPVLTVRGTETVLLVEDEAPLRRLVARVLGGFGYQVFVAGSGPEALELLEDLERPPDLLLTDVVLPGGMQGNDVAAAFVRRIPGLPVLYVSGHARDAIVHSGRLDEGVNFLAKPFAPEALAIKVREVLDANNRKR